MASGSDVEARPEAMGDEDLVAAAVGGAQVQERTAALKELLRRRSPRVRPLLGRMVADTAVPPEVRTTAAIALGREATAENEEALRQALGSQDASVVAAAAASLARIGGRSAFDALSRAGAEPGAGAARSVTFARTLISYRLGLGAERLPDPSPTALLEVDRARAVPLPLEEVGPEDFRAGRRWLERELPAIPVTPRGSVRFSCRGEHLWLVLAEDMVGQGRLPVGERDRVAAAVLKESTCPDGWFVHEYVLTHPRQDGGAAVFGVRSTGKLVHFGEVREEGANAAVQLRAVDAPGVAALELHAELLGPEAALVIREALCAPPRGERRSRPSTPSRGPEQRGEALG